MKPITTEDGSKTLYSDKFRETYHSIHGAKTEALHVFVNASGIVEHLNNFPNTRVLEVGFGLGLNFLLTADLALKDGGSLHYHAFELEPIQVDTLESLAYRDELLFPGLVDLAILALSDDLNTETGHYHNSTAATGFSNVNLKITQGDISRCALPTNHYDYIYLDAFSPDVNSECWDKTAFDRYFEALRDGGTLCSYSAKGNVRRSMLAAGFNVDKLPGPPGKREMLTAVRPKPTQT